MISNCSQIYGNNNTCNNLFPKKPFCEWGCVYTVLILGVIAPKCAYITPTSHLCANWPTDNIMLDKADESSGIV